MAVVKTLQYEKVRSQIRPGDILGWSEAKGLLTPIISWVTESKTTHVSVVLMRIEAHEPRLLQMEAYESGRGILVGKVEPSFISTRIKKYMGAVTWYQLNPDLDQYRAQIVASLWDCMGKGYDYFSLVRNLFGRVPENPEDFFCSELAEYALNKGIPWQAIYDHPEWLEVPATRIFFGPLACVPGDIVKLPFLKKMGRLMI